MANPFSSFLKMTIAWTAFVAVIGITLFQAEFSSPHYRSVLLLTSITIGILFVFREREYRKKLNRQQDKIEQLMGIKLVLASLIDLKDPYTEGHSKNVRDLTIGFSKYLGLPLKVCEEYALAAELHDIGKIGIPDAILKKPDKLKTAEYMEIKDHPQLGAESLKTLQGFETIRASILHHHEKFDGTGYPQGLAGEQIPLGSRIIALADSYDAMLHGREYRPPLPLKEVFRVLEEQSGKQFDPVLSSAFLEFLHSGIQSGSRDPVCGMAVNPENKNIILENAGQKWLFCSEVCLKTFQDNPEKYLLEAAPSQIKPEN